MIRKYGCSLAPIQDQIEKAIENALKFAMPIKNLQEIIHKKNQSELRSGLEKVFANIKILIKKLLVSENEIKKSFLE